MNSLAKTIAALFAAALLSACCGRGIHSVATSKCGQVGSSGCNNCCRVNGAKSGTWGASCTCYN